MSAVVLIARIVLCAVFAVAGATKLADRDGTAFTLEDFGLPRRSAMVGAVLLPVCELAVAVLLLPDATAVAAAAGAAALLGLFIVGISVNLARGHRPECNCFGQIHSTPVGPATLVRNVALLGLAAIVLAGGHGDAGAAALSQLGRADTATVLAASALALVVVGLGLMAWLAMHLLRQQGRVLLRLDALDGGAAFEAAMPESRAPRLPLGAPAPAFELPAMDGKLVALAGLAEVGRPLVLAFVDPGCGSCRTLLPDLGRRQREDDGGGPVVIVSNTDVGSAAALASEYDIPLALLDADGSVSRGYQVAGTPTAIAVGSDGLIRSEPAEGADAVRDLLGRLDGDGGDGFALAIMQVGAAGNAESETTPRLGEPVPDLDLEALGGGSVSLHTAAAGHPHLLLFWSATCGFCDAMLDDVLAMEGRDDLPPLLVIVNGAAEATREQGLRSPTFLDAGFEGLGPALGVSGTPSALRLDAEGRIVSRIALGADGVLALAGVERQA